MNVGGSGGRVSHPGPGWPALLSCPLLSWHLLWGHLKPWEQPWICDLITYREDITYRLPELDPRGSDEENLDSETSASTESLLEERAGRGTLEGQY